MRKTLLRLNRKLWRYWFTKNIFMKTRSLITDCNSRGEGRASSGYMSECGNTAKYVQRLLSVNLCFVYVLKVRDNERQQC